MALLLVLLADPAWAAEESGSPVATMFWQGLNLVLLVSAIVYFARKPILAALADRRQAIQKDLESSKELLAQAESRLAEWQARSGRLEAELAEIRDASSRTAEQERSEILEQAHAAAERIRQDATAAVDQELRRARAELSAEAAELAVGLAERMLAEHVAENDQRRLFDEFVERLEAPTSDAGGRS